MKKHQLAYRKYNEIMKDDYARYLLIASYVGGHFEPLNRRELNKYFREMNEDFERAVREHDLDSNYDPDFDPDDDDWDWDDDWEHDDWRADLYDDTDEENENAPDYEPFMSKEETK